MTDTNDSDDDVSAVDVLGVSAPASTEKVMEAFRKHARRYHPDKFDPDDVDIADAEELNANDLFKDVKQARDELVDDASGVSYNYEWRNGTPVTERDTGDPTERKSDESTVDDDDEGEEEDDSDRSGGSDDDGTGGPTGGDSGDGPEETADDEGDGWNTDEPGDGSGIDDTVNVNIGGNSEDGAGGGAGDAPEVTVAIGNEISTRGLLIGGASVGAVILANWFGVFNAVTDAESEGSRTEEHVVVGPDDVLQEAAETIVPGGTLELEPGTYSQRVAFAEDLTVTAPDGATIAGGGANGVAVAVGNADVELNGLRIVEFDGGGIHSGDDGGNLTLSNITIEDVNGSGVELAGERIEIEDLTVRNTVGTGVSLSVPSDGSVTIDGVVARDNEDSGVGAATEGRGIVVEGGERVAISDAEVLGSGNEGIHVLASEVGSQDVEITDTFVADSASRAGIHIEGSRDSETVRLTDVEVVDNDDEGVRIGTEHHVSEVILDGITAEDNDDTGLDVRVTDDGTVSVRGSVFDRNEDGVGIGTDGHGVRVRGGEHVVIEETTIAESGYANLRVEGERVDGQSVELRDVDVFASVASSGVRFDGSRGADEIVVERCRADENDGYGFDLAGESVRIEGTTATENGDGSLRLQDIDRDDAEIQDSFRDERE